LQHAKNFGLGRQAQITNLVQKERALVGVFEVLWSPIDSGRNTLFNAKQLGL